MKIVYLLLISVSLVGCGSSIYSIDYCGNTYPGNEIPRYNRIVKPENLLKADAEFIENAIKTYGNREEAYNRHVRLGWHYFYENSKETSIKRFNQAWLLDSTKSDAYFGFAAYTKLIGCEKESDKYYEIGKSLDSDNTSLKLYHKSLIMYFTHLGDNQSVIKFIKKYELGNPLFPEDYSALGFYYSEINDFENADKYLLKAITKNSMDSVAYLNLGWAHYKRNEFQLAIEYFTKAINIAPNYVNAYAKRANSYAELKDYSNAIQDNYTCIKLVGDSDKPQFYWSIGNLKIADGKKSEGCADLKIALSLVEPGKDVSDLEKIIKNTCSE